MILNYKKFLEDNISNIDESVIYFSSEFEKVLKEIEDKTDNRIASALLSINIKDIEPDISIIDIKEDDYLKFYNSTAASKTLLQHYAGIGEFKDLNVEEPDKRKLVSNLIKQVLLLRDNFLDKGNSIKIGRIITRIFDDKFSNKEVEEFVNLFKAYTSRKLAKFEIVSGEKIKECYWFENYLSMKGTLGNSCMAKKVLFDVYIKNPEVCRLVVLRRDGKVAGRALLWKLDTLNGKELEEDTYFMDRQYTINEEDVVSFRNYANENNWIYKSRNNHYSFEYVYIKGVEKVVSMTVKINQIEYSNYPYMDTFRKYDKENGILLNNGDKSDKGYLLNDTNGGYVDLYSMVYSNYHEQYISRDEAVYSERLSDWLNEESAVEVTRGSERYLGFYPDGYDDILYSTYYDAYIHADESVDSNYLHTYILRSESVRVTRGSHPRYRGYYPKNHIDIRYDNIKNDYIYFGDAVWSKQYDSYIYKLNCVYSIDIDIDSFNKVGLLNLTQDAVYKDEGVTEVSYSKENNWLKAVLSEVNQIGLEVTSIDSAYYFRSDIFDYDGSIPEIFKTDIYKCKSGYLSEIDASILGEEIDKNDRETMWSKINKDLFEYTYDLDRKTKGRLDKNLKLLIKNNYDDKYRKRMNELKMTYAYY